MNEIAGWIAPVATMLAAMMTAANLGARVTGTGFVIFTLGSVCWSIVGFSSGQTNLLATNSFLTLVNLVGVWRWLGRQRAYEDGGRSAETASRHSATPNLFTATGLAGLPVLDRRGRKLGKVVEALLRCDTGEISYVVLARGGVGGVAETLHAIERDAVRFSCDHITLRVDAEELTNLPPLADDAWPSAAPRKAMVALMARAR
jgi:sporulation protein YlmC with PRC-barrel domain